MQIRLINRNTWAAAGVVAAALAAGCAPSYEHQRPPVDQLDRRDAGLQSKDVLQASDSLAMDLLSLRDLNASPTQWTIVVDKVEDNTRDNLFKGDFNIFLQRLQTNLARQGRGRIQLIENRARFHDIRERELEGGGGDDFGQHGAGGSSGGATGNPQYALYAKAMDLPGRGTTYYNLQFQLVDLQRRTIAWTGDYEVRVSRE